MSIHAVMLNSKSRRWVVPEPRWYKTRNIRYRKDPPSGVPGTFTFDRAGATSGGAGGLGRVISRVSSKPWMDGTHLHVFFDNDPGTIDIEEDSRFVMMYPLDIWWSGGATTSPPIWNTDLSIQPQNAGGHLSAVSVAFKFFYLSDGYDGTFTWNNIPTRIAASETTLYTYTFPLTSEDRSWTVQRNKAMYFNNGGTKSTTPQVAWWEIPLPARDGVGGFEIAPVVTYTSDGVNGDNTFYTLDNLSADGSSDNYWDRPADSGTHWLQAKDGFMPALPGDKTVDYWTTHDYNYKR